MSVILSYFDNLDHVNAIWHRLEKITANLSSLCLFKWRNVRKYPNSVTTLTLDRILFIAISLYSNESIN